MKEGIVNYGDHPLNQLKLYQFNESNDETLLLIHGGAWRDPNNTYNDFEDIISHILKSQNSAKYNLVAINYRLSPEIKHPYHLWDVLKGLQYLVQNYSIRKILIVGHSVGATLMLQLLDYNKILDCGFLKLQTDLEDGKCSAISEGAYLHVPLDKERTLLNKTMENLQLKTFVFLDGIYDVVQLIDEYGDAYESFIKDAFSSPEQYSEATQLSCTTIDIRSPFSFNLILEGILKELTLVVLQSSQDELLSMRQTNLFIKYLTQKNLIFKSLIGEWGEHEQVYRHADVAKIVLDSI